MTACMSQLYARASASTSPLTPHPPQLVGGPDGMIEGFAAMLRSQSAQPEGLVVIVVSEEAKDYRPEMAWMAKELTARGLETHCIEPRQVRFTEQGLRLVEAGDRPIGLIYRFYELFDLPNIPKSELIQYAAKKGLVSVTPPYKPALEEKSAFALLHHPVLAPYWRTELGEELVCALNDHHAADLGVGSCASAALRCDPGSLDRRPGGDELERSCRRDTKAEAFCPQAVRIFRTGLGQPRGLGRPDLPQNEWTAAIEAALAAFPLLRMSCRNFIKAGNTRSTISMRIAERSGRWRDEQDCRPIIL